MNEQAQALNRVARALELLGNGDAHTGSVPMGAIEAFGMAHRDAVNGVRDELSEVAGAINEVANALNRIADALGAKP